MLMIQTYSTEFIAHDGKGLFLLYNDKVV